MPRKPGRPPLDPHSPSRGVSVRLTAKLFDAVYAEARAARITMPELIRRRAFAALARADRRER